MPRAVAGCCRRLATAGTALLVAAGSLLTVPLAGVAAAGDPGLDPSFGVGGLVRGPRGTATALALDSADRKIVGGYVDADPGNEDFDVQVARYTASGRLDAGFGRDGFACADTTNGTVEDIALAPGGAVVVGGSSSETSSLCRMTVARFTADGAPDTTFSGDGVVDVVIGARATTVPRRGLDFAVVRLTREGVIDFRFADNGVAHVTFGDGRDALSGVEIDAAGRIVAAGTTYPTYPSRPDGLFAVAALVP